MLRLELDGQKYNKTRHRRALLDRLNGRTEGSVELKHQNISAVLIEMGIPYIDGYKPRRNYQRTLLPGAVSSFLKHHPEMQLLFKADAEAEIKIPSVNDILAALEAPPPASESKESVIRDAPAIYNPGGVNYLEQEARNQSLGEAGEQFVMNFERARLIRSGRDAFADRVEQVSLTEGPAAGFDIRSFEENGTDRFIEAKTTKYGKNTPFYVTSNELKFSEENASNYFLYRLFRFRAEPRMYVLQGHLPEKCTLKPTQYIARTL